VHMHVFMSLGHLPSHFDYTFSSVTFKDEKGRSWKWKNVKGGGQMTVCLVSFPDPSSLTFAIFQLYLAGDKTPAAGYLHSLKYTDRSVDPPVRKTREPTLTLDPRGQEIKDLVVVSFLILEKERRLKENSAANLINSEAIQLIDVK